MLPVAWATLIIEPVFAELTVMLYLAVYVAVSPAKRVPEEEPELDELNVGPLSRVSAPPLPSVIVSVKLKPVMVKLPVLATVIV